MKIALLTLPFVNNYGGILQAYALKHFLELRGHSVCIIDRNSNFKISFIDILRLAKRKFLGNRIRNFAYFKKQYLLPMTSEIITNKEMLLLDEKYQFDIYIVGSDQVWRAIYYRDIKYNFYLDFVSSKRKISFAASFGISSWEYTNTETDIIAKLLMDFSFVSVREDTAVRLCSDYLNINAVQFLDPTFLLDKNEYCCLADCFYSSKKIDIFAYIMGPDSSKDKLIKIISDYSGLSVQSITQSKFSFKKNESIQEWLQNFYKSKFVVTDSFHGLAFSLIFNKPFIVCGFRNRGMGRYESLLRYFSLENRLLYSLEDLKELNLSTIWDINWKEVNAKIAENKRFVLELMQTVGV